MLIWEQALSVVSWQASQLLGLEAGGDLDMVTSGGKLRVIIGYEVASLHRKGGVGQQLQNIFQGRSLLTCHIARPPTCGLPSGRHLMCLKGRPFLSGPD